ncbi:MAG: EAL domain-containing protein, partial [Hyphomonas sp.]|nr:EAL domain-containing protein [Hyphomonas sp.]
IKIDKSFVKDIESRPESRAITIATLNLAKSLGMRSTAEGVETLYQAEFLRDNGCDELQGFFISRAQPLDGLGHVVAVRPAGEVIAPKPELIEAPGDDNIVPFTNEKRAQN